MYRTILVPLDGSNRAERALPHAEGLARSFGARVVLIRVVDPRAAMLGHEGNNTSLHLAEFRHRAGEAEEYLESIRQLLAKRSVEVMTRLAYGDVVDSIIAAAREMDVGLIVITSHGRRGMARVFYGSIAAGILQRVDRPLLVIRARRDE